METCVALDKTVCDSNFLPLEVYTVPAHGRICSEKKTLVRSSATKAQ